MAWLPWAALPARSSMTTRELVDWLRAHAIEFGAPPQFIDAIDKLLDLEDSAAENDEVAEERDMLMTALEDLLEEISADDVPENVVKAADAAQKVLDDL